MQGTAFQSVLQALVRRVQHHAQYHNLLGGKMRKSTTILMAILALLTCQIVLQAQITTGSISGTVTDQTGAVVPGANVTVKGEAGQQYTAVTKGDGVYTVPGVPAGTHT